jgi:LysM repeat protein
VIARKYGVKVDALMAANPKLDPRRLQVGQALIIPPP